MCGIFCTVSRNGTQEDNLKVYEKCAPSLKNRGPDNTDICHVCGSNENILLAGSVLWTQGNALYKQPARHSSGNILLWNGDVYDGIIVEEGKSDCEVILELFHNEGVIAVLSRIEGPYAFIYYEHESKKIWFGRDPLGRVSLLWSASSSSLTLSSVSCFPLNLVELPPTGLFVLQLNSFVLTVHPWAHRSRINHSSAHSILVDQPIIYRKLNNLLLASEFKLPEKNELTFINDFVKSNGDVSLLFNKLLGDESAALKDVNNLFTLLDEAVKCRCSIRPPFCRKCKVEHLSSCTHPKIGVLFSGGLDSTILALLANRHVPLNDEIDLYNVAFEKSNSENPYDSPDRLTGLASLVELQNLAPNRIWNFVKIDVPKDRLNLERDSHINRLIYPLSTILDDSLGCALWFAASGKGTVNGHPYTSPATIVLLGMGADEMFGGYRKARRIWLDGGWHSLSEELVSGVINLPKRNLGRDNRCVSDHSRVPRFPFIDEKVVSYVYSLPPWRRCYLGRELPEGVGDKLLLRIFAWKCGLRNAALLPKRALQFGSRIANSKEVGHHLSQRLQQCWHQCDDPT